MPTYHSYQEVTVSAVPEGTTPQESIAVLFQRLLGRAPMTLPELLVELNKADWPDSCYVHSLDFMALSQLIPMNKDDHGLYFIVGNTQVRPSGKEGLLDLSDYAGPNRIVVPRPAPSQWDFGDPRGLEK